MPKYLSEKKNGLLIVVFVLTSGITYSQDTIKFETIKSVRDIPHATPKQKWMWIHRSVAFTFMKKRLPYWDTTYYASYKGQLVTTIPITTRFIDFEFKDASSSNFLRFVPNSQYDIGISINSKFASFLINSGVSFLANDEGKRGKTSYGDYQFNLYGKRSTIDVALQTYQGFYIQNSNKFAEYRNTRSQPYEIRPDVEVNALSVNYYYIFNYKKFSYRTSFSFIEHQKKSIGSFLCGGYASLFSITADSSLVSGSFASYFNSTDNTKAGGVSNFGFNVGYIYTLVIKKKIHATLSLVQGLGTSKTTLTKEDDSRSNGNYKFSSKQNLRIALGYDSGRFFYGTMGLFDSYYFNDESASTFNYSSGKFRIFAGYRFPIENLERKLLRKLNLIDYRL